MCQDKTPEAILEVEWTFFFQIITKRGYNVKKNLDEKCNQTMQNNNTTTKRNHDFK